MPSRPAYPGAQSWQYALFASGSWPSGHTAHRSPTGATQPSGHGRHVDLLKSGSVPFEQMVHFVPVLTKVSEGPAMSVDMQLSTPSIVSSLLVVEYCLRTYSHVAVGPASIHVPFVAPKSVDSVRLQSDVSFLTTTGTRADVQLSATTMKSGTPSAVEAEYAQPSGQSSSLSAPALVYAAAQSG